MNNTRMIKQIVKGMKASDGDGVQLTRLIGSPYLDQLDPFLLFDAFGSDKPQDYIGGFPAHPHRGFETVTYMLEGKMRHQDSAGNAGVISAGDIQWMTAGSGIIHSEMPEQSQGLLAGFQLWVNLPADKKMTEPNYQEKSAKEIPIEHRGAGVSIKVIAGKTKNETQGVIINDRIKPTYWHVKLPAGQIFNDVIDPVHNAFIYMLTGELFCGDKKLQAKDLAILGTGKSIKLTSKSQPAEFLLIAGQPLKEPVVRAGPFVMNSQKEINQAIRDYQNGTLI
jgi:redox-sensitive bicupin YhaK (pirin superfamily)